MLVKKNTKFWSQLKIMDEQYFQKAIKDYDLSEKAQNALIINNINNCSSFLNVDIKKLYYTEKGHNQTKYELSCFKDMLREKLLSEPKMASSERKSESPNHELSSDFSKPNSQVDPEDVIAWMVTQPNANGKLYLENVVRQYMSALRVAPGKLQIPDAINVKSVFTCHTPDELNASWDIFKAATNYKQVNRRTSGMFSAGMGCYMRYLQYLADVHSVKKPDIIHLIERHNLEYVDKRDSGGALWVIGGKELSPTMIKFRKSGFPFLLKVGGGRSSDYRDAWWYKSYKTVSRGRSEDSEDVQHVYTELNGIPSSEQQSDTTCAELCAETPVLDPTITECISNVLSSHFSNGYRLDSLIELARFRSFASDDLGEEIRLADEELKNYITVCGTTFDGKVYAVSAQVKERIRNIAEEYFEYGGKAIFFAEFYAKNENWLFEASVVSEPMLIEILMKLFPRLSFTRTYFGYTDASIFAAVEDEILRMWGEDVLLNYGQLAERLRYTPLERIKSALAQNGDFIWSSVETFSHVSRIEITDEERQLICNAAMRECNALGYASIADMPLCEIEERNYELSTTAVQNAVYRTCLSDKFDKKGKILVHKGDVIDALTIMKEHCRSIDKCTLDDLLAYEKELTGNVQRWIPMEVGNTVLVRIGKNTYVADKYLQFNSDIIDEAIDLFVEGDYLPLKSFTTFGAFPDCGETWNLFLLESYCRRFSRKFRFDTPSINSRNAGAVIRKSCGMNYTQIMSDAVAKTDVPLKAKVVSNFLYDCGYIARRNIAKANEIIDKAKAIRERRD